MCPASPSVLQVLSDYSSYRKNMKTGDYRPLLLSNWLPEMHLNNPEPDSLRFSVK
jgi:hypothetical protein